MRSLWTDLGASFRSPGFWAFASWLDVVVRYRQSRLGLFWLVVPAVVYIWGLGSFFAAMSGTPIRHFAAYVAIGWLVFRVIQTVITDSTGAFAASASFILDGHVRLTDFVLQVASKSLFYFTSSLPVAAIALAVSPEVHAVGFLLAAVGFLVILLNLLWIGVVFSLIGARFRDMGQFIGNIFMFAFLLTPIIWQADAMPAESLRATLMRINPLYHLVELVRAPILGTTIAPSTLYYVAVMTTAGWLAASLAYRRYARFVPIWV